VSKKQIGLLKGLLGLQLIAVTSMSSGAFAGGFSGLEISAPSVKVERSGTHIYYRTSWTQLSQDDQKTIIDQSIVLLKNELKENLNGVTGLRTLSSQMLSDKALDLLTSEAQKSVQFADTHSLRGLLPSGLLLYGGVNGGVGVGVNGGFSGDLGEVIFPEKVVEVDTETWASKEYIKIDHAMVVVPHIHIGLGAGGGVSYSAGAALIFGNMTTASDFHGAIISGSADIKLAFGGDAQVSAVHNISTSQNFFLVTGEFDWGIEAKASVDGEGGYIYSLDEIGTLFGKKLQSGGSVELPINGKTPAPQPSSSK
jgi:hypothetical protein